MTNDRLEELARERWSAHDDLISEGYELGPKSGFWQMRDGTLTGRLIYRLRGSHAAGIITTLAITIRKIPVEYV